ncbi:MAG: PorT family protein [Bacteroidetes bacterium]|nr:PorT family protein [Bacteroidota bacterium]
MRTLIALTIVVATAVAANAQFMINPVLGVNTLVLSTDPPNASANTLIGWSVGVNGRIGNHFFFEPGIHYMMQKNGVTVPNYNDGQTTADFVAKDNLSYLSVPLLFGLKLLGTKEHDQLFNINVHAGLTPSFLMSATNTNTNKDVSKAYRTVGLAVGGGLGLDILFFTLDADLDLGLTDLYNTDNRASLPAAVAPTLDGYHGKPIGFHVNLGFKYQFDTDDNKKKDDK